MCVTQEKEKFAWIDKKTIINIYIYRFREIIWGSCRFHGYTAGDEEYPKIVQRNIKQIP